ATHERAAHEGTRGITNNHVDTSQLIEQNVARGQVGRDALSHANPSHRVDSPQPVDSKRYDADTAAGVALSTLSNRDDMELRSTPGPILWPDEMALADSQPRAVTTLLNLWGKNVGVGAFEKPCDAANRAQLACVSRKAQTIMDIRQLNRPVILTVADPRKGLFLATLASLNQDYAVLHVADHKVVVSARVLTQQWTGEYVLFWQAPSNYDGAIVPGAVGPKVFSFSRDLGRVMGSHSLAQGVSDFGIELEMAVRDFQRRQGLIVDGIAGVQTLVSMNTILLKGRVPTLSTGSTDINRATRTALRKS
ncbi:MAG: peptidoglycan-binding domain-containing protein, partial [Gammaproteobacteria bacterium]